MSRRRPRAEDVDVRRKQPRRNAQADVFPQPHVLDAEDSGEEDASSDEIIQPQGQLQHRHQARNCGNLSADDASDEDEIAQEDTIVVHQVTQRSFDTTDVFDSFPEYFYSLRGHVREVGHIYCVVTSTPVGLYNRSRHGEWTIPASMGPYYCCVYRCHCESSFTVVVTTGGDGLAWVFSISNRVSHQCVPRPRGGHAPRDQIEYLSQFLPNPLSGKRDPEVNAAGLGGGRRDHQDNRLRGRFNNRDDRDQRAPRNRQGDGDGAPELQPRRQGREEELDGDGNRAHERRFQGPGRRANPSDGEIRRQKRRASRGNVGSDVGMDSDEASAGGSRAGDGPGLGVDVTGDGTGSDDQDGTETRGETTQARDMGQAQDRRQRPERRPTEDEGWDENVRGARGLLKDSEGGEAEGARSKGNATLQPLSQTQDRRVQIRRRGIDATLSVSPSILDKFSQAAKTNASPTRFYLTNSRRTEESVDQ